MRWTDKTPTQSGLYWYRQANGETDSIELDEKLMTETMSHVDDITEWWGIVAWCGPLTPPAYNLDKEQQK